MKNLFPHTSTRDHRTDTQTQRKRGIGSNRSHLMRAVLFRSLAVLDPRVGHTMDVLSPFIPVLCHSDWLFHGESCPRLDVVHPGRAWPSSPACTWHCSLHYLFLKTTPLFPHGVTIKRPRHTECTPTFMASVRVLMMIRMKMPYSKPRDATTLRSL